MIEHVDSDQLTGFAWHYTQYNDETDLADAEAYAMQRRKGIWSFPDPIALWDCRKQKRKNTASR